MAKQVNGFLAMDGTFFDTEAECRRYECRRTIEMSCESHGINSVNFFMLLREWSYDIREYYNADSQCEAHEVTPTGNVRFESDVPSTESDLPDTPFRDHDTPGFLEQQIRRHK